MENEDVEKARFRDRMRPQLGNPNQQGWDFKGFYERPPEENKRAKLGAAVNYIHGQVVHGQEDELREVAKRALKVQLGEYIEKHKDTFMDYAKYLMQKKSRKNPNNDLDAFREYLTDSITFLMQAKKDMMAMGDKDGLAVGNVAIDEWTKNKATPLRIEAVLLLADNQYDHLFIEDEKLRVRIDAALQDFKPFAAELNAMAAAMSAQR